MADKNSTALTENYVQEYYDSGLKQMSEKYTNWRWFSSVESKFDYQQTKFAILEALGSKKFSTGLEIGPGDGVWTPLFKDRTEALTLLDQSEEMLKRAKDNLKEYTDIEYTHINFANYEPTSKHDFVVSIRCFEYIVDKEAAVKKIADSMLPGATLILVTKNPNYVNASGWKKTRLHTEQIGKRDLKKMFAKQGLKVESIFPAVYRWKSKYRVMRWLFSALQYLSVKSSGWFYIPWLTDWSTESYTYVVTKPKVMVELYGLPGSGKTTLAKELKAKYSRIDHQRPRSRGMGFVYFILRYPIKALVWSMTLLKHTWLNDDWSLFRYRLAILLNTFECIGSGVRSKKGLVVLEEGLLQRISAVYESKRTPEEMSFLLRFLPEEVKGVVLVDASNYHFHRYQNPVNTRTRKGKAYLDEFFQIVRHNHRSLMIALEKYPIAKFNYGKDAKVGEVYDFVSNL